MQAARTGHNIMGRRRDSSRRFPSAGSGSGTNRNARLRSPFASFHGQPPKNPAAPLTFNHKKVLTMKTQLLGNSDLSITRVGFGAWAVGGDWQFGWGSQDDDDSIAAIHRALELGINWIDTAAIYGLGHSEEVVARALKAWKGPRPYVFTKCGMIWNNRGEVGYSLRAESIRRECEASLRRLKTDVIDLYQIHWTADDLNETLEGWSVLATLQKEGKVRWIGVSNASAAEMEKLQTIAPITSL